MELGSSVLTAPFHQAAALGSVGARREPHARAVVSQDAPLADREHALRRGWMVPCSCGRHHRTGFGNVCDSRTVLPSQTPPKMRKPVTHEKGTDKPVTHGNQIKKSGDLSNGVRSRPLFGKALRSFAYVVRKSCGVMQSRRSTKASDKRGL